MVGSDTLLLTPQTENHLNQEGLIIILVQEEIIIFIIILYCLHQLPSHLSSPFLHPALTHNGCMEAEIKRVGKKDINRITALVLRIR